MTDRAGLVFRFERDCGYDPETVCEKPRSWSPFCGCDGDKTPTGPYFDSGERDGPVGVPVQRYAVGVFLFRPLLKRYPRRAGVHQERRGGGHGLAL
ncbi:hypothetical protein GEV33_000152 [Tenebrio molitor]|uniref:Uncharacterized protein n=1 Tax=Tenebrio molitor TaxID=7067 RepID=A0A8J6LH93_TENMO|nr:hypothetical protein GEV33_000152 [Tenebrio molitor]